MKKYELILAFAALLLIPVATLQAQSTFAPDRPGLGDGTYVVQPGVAYLELGAEYYDGGTIDQFSLGQIMLRYGLVRNVELRLSLNSYIVQNYPVGDETGVEDPGLGLKFALYHHPDSPLTLSGLASVSIPVGYSPFTDDQWHPSAALLADYQLSGHWSINSNVGYSLNAGEEPDQFMFTFTPGFAIGESSYGGYFGYALFASSDYSQHFIEAGITRLVTDSIQLDVNTGVDVKNGDAFVGAGLALQL